MLLIDFLTEFALGGAKGHQLSRRRESSSVTFPQSMPSSEITLGSASSHASQSASSRSGMLAPRRGSDPPLTA